MTKKLEITGDQQDNLLVIDGEDRTYVHAKKGDDRIEDRGGVDDKVKADGGDDVVAYFHSDNDAGENSYDGGKGADTLELHFTREEWMALNPSIQADLDNLLTHLASKHAHKKFDFDTLDLEIKEFESIHLFVDGEELSAEDNAVVAADDQVTTNENVSVSGSVLDNDEVPDLVRHVEMIGEGPSVGQVALDEAGNYSFDQLDDFEYLAVDQETTVSFDYRVTDATGDTDTATMTFTVVGQNDGPTLQGTSTELVEDGPVVTVDLSLLGDDVDSDDDGTTLTYTVSQQPPEGLATINGTDLIIGTNGDFQYLSAGQKTTVTLEVTATDRHNAAATNSVTATVTGVNDLPILGVDHADLMEDGFAEIDVLANDSDVDQLDQLQIVAVQGAQHGTVQIVDGDDADDLANDLILYTADPDYAGTDSFVYTVDDGNGGVVQQTVTVNVEAVADAPTISHQVIPGATAAQFTLRVTAQQTDLDGSEVMDKIELIGLDDSGNPVDLSPYFDKSVVWATGPDGTITGDFHFNLPSGSAADFDLIARATSRETSNGDTATSETSLPIDLSFASGSSFETFTAQNRSIWHNGSAFAPSVTFTYGGDIVESAEFGISVFGPIDLRLAGFGVTSHFSTLLRGDISVDLEMSTTMGLNGGAFDAQVGYDTSFSSIYNGITDQLTINTAANFNPGASAFQADAPNFNLSQDLTDFSFGFGFGLWFWGYLQAHYAAGSTFIIDMANINHGIVIGSNGYHEIELPAFNIANYDGNTLRILNNIFQYSDFSGTRTDGLGNELFSWQLNSHALEANSSFVYGSTLYGGASREVINLTFDLDGLASSAAGIKNPVSYSLPGFDIEFLSLSAGADLMDLDLVLATAYSQNHSLTGGTLRGTLVFEDGSTVDFNFGDEINIDNASAKDVNGDGQIAFSFEMTPDARFHTSASLNLSVQDQLDILSGHVGGHIVGYGDFGETIGPVEEYNGTIINLAQYIPIYSNEFHLTLDTVESETWLV